jgi:hypothetical protein
VGDEQIDVTHLPVDIWLDDAGRIRRVILHCGKRPLPRSTSRASAN